MKAPSVSLRAALLFLLVLLPSLLWNSPAHAVQVSATYNNTSSAGYTNLMNLPGTPQILDPGLPDFGTLGLAAPAVGSSTTTTSFAYPSNAPTVTNPVQMYGDAISTITNLGAGAFQVDVTVTKFFFEQGTPQFTDEYVYLNVWETFTNLGLPSNLTWATTGNLTINGIWTAGAGQFLTIEPIVTVFDPSVPAWTAASPFVGSPHTGPGGGLLTGTKAVNSLTPYATGGQLTVGMQTIFMLDDLAGTGPGQMHLPTSLDLSIILTPVPVPEPSTLMMAALGLAGLAGWRWRSAPR